MARGERGGVKDEEGGLSRSKREREKKEEN